jgi:magnesium-transporting ATPase (P-type)
MATTQPPDWHSRQAAQVLAELGARAQGLDAQEAARRLRVDGPNRLPATPPRSALQRLAAQVHNPLIYALLAAALISLLLRHGVDAVVILAVVVVNAAVGFVQEGRAEQALAALQDMVAPRCSVLRDGRRLAVPAEQIARGDVVLLDAGDRVPADLRLLDAHALKLDEAILTGESVPVDKDGACVPADAPLGERGGMAFSGTYVAAGQGAGVVVATGAATELGRISTLLGGVQPLKTPLLAQMDRFARRLTALILAASAAVFALAVLARGYPAADAFMVVVGLAVAAIPEGLPAVLTITLAIGVQRMARRHAIVRRLPAVETLGAVSVICTDKTGTLTRSEMTARAVLTAAGAYAATGVGYDPAGTVQRDGRDCDAKGDPALLDLVRAAALCNDAAMRHGGADWTVAGDPMEGALLVLAHKAGLDPAAVRAQLPRQGAIPFDAQHRFMATLHRGEDGTFIAIKGAPERVLDMCTHALGPEGPRPLERDAWHARAEALAAQGQRVLAFARKPVPDRQTGIGFRDVEGATLLGCVGLLDPPRPEAAAAVAECRSAGIRVVMITGDHAVTARAIAHQLGLADDPRTLTGRDLDALDAAGVRAAVREAVVFARTTPEHKLRLVEALQAEGLTVAMTGDGVNDAPALKRADVGIAMGRKGTEVAKQAAEMVLADDNFATIVAAVRAGRTVYDNLRKVIAWTLPTNGGEALTVIAALALGLALPVTPVQILWINMVTAVALGLTLAFEPTEPGTMARAPRRRDAPLLTGELGWRIAFVSVLFVAGAFGVFFWAQQRGLPLETARTLVVNTLVAMEVFYLFSVRYVHGTALTWRGVLGTPAVLAGVGVVVLAQLAFTYLPGLQRVFDTHAVTLGQGLLAVSAGAALLALAEAEKALRRRAGRRRRE